MAGRSVGVVMGVLLLAVSCGSAGADSRASVTVGAATEAGEGFEVVAVSDVPVGEMVASGAAEAAGGGVLVLVSAGLDSLTVGWAESAAPDATGFRLRWRPRRAGDEKAVWESADLEAAARSYTIEGLEAGWRYRLRLSAFGGDDVEVDVAVADFFTLAPGVRNLSAKATSHDAVEVRWRSPAGWSPVGYVLQWRHGTPGPFIGHAQLPPGSRDHLVTGLDGDRRYVFRVTALTSRGWQSNPDAVRTRTREAPESALRLEVSVPAYCVAAEGRPDGGDFDPETFETIWDRVGVASVPLQWRLSGGTEPYTLSILGEQHQGATGSVAVSCAKAGADFSDPEADLVTSGAKTFTIEAADATGATTTRTLNIEIIETASSAGSLHRGDTLQPGHIYHQDGLYIEIPEGARISYAGTAYVDPVRGHIGPFVSAVRGFYSFGSGSRVTNLYMDPGTGEEAHPSISRSVYWVTEDGGLIRAFDEEPTDVENETWDRFLANIRTTPFSAGDPRNEPPVPLLHSAGVRGSQGAETPLICTDINGALQPVPGDRWLPYGALPPNALNLHGLRCELRVSAHPSLLVGDPITVCVTDGAQDGLLVPAITAAVNDWNTLLAPNHDDPDPSKRKGLDYEPFEFDASLPDCPAGLKAVNTGHVQVFDIRTCHAINATNCSAIGRIAGYANTYPSDITPRVTRNELVVVQGVGASHTEISVELERILRHELGHFLGLVDYGSGCWRAVDGSGNVQPTMMSSGPDVGGQTDGSVDPAGCFSATITARDLADLHAIYHPPAVENLSLTDEFVLSLTDEFVLPLTGDFVDRWVIRWGDSAVFPAEFNSAWSAVLGRSTFVRDPATGALTAPPSAWRYLNHQAPTLRRHLFARSADVAGFEYTVANMTRGDHQRLQPPAGVGLGIHHGSLTLPGDSRPWTLGSETTTVAAPAPVGRYTLGFDGFRQVHFGATGAGQSRFSVVGADTTLHGIPLDAGDLLIARQPAPGEADPFDPANLQPVNITYGTTTVAVTGCRARGFRNSRYLCHVSADLPLDPTEVPLRLIVTAASAGGASPLAGTHPVERNNHGFINYGGTDAGQWRFAFWGRTITGLRVSHGGPVTLRPGDIVISHAEPFGPNGFADSPFAAGRFTPLRIHYANTQITAAGCTTHFYNVDRYECHIAGAFTFNADNIPDHVTVNRQFASGPTTPPPAATPGTHPADDQTPTTCTTTPTTPCARN